MRILIATDAFPPNCGGSGWSAFHLARELARADHEVRVVKPLLGGTGAAARRYEELDVVEVGVPDRDLPFVRSWLRGERLRQRLHDFLVEELAKEPADVIHAQHVLSAPGAVAAGETLGIPVVVTVRDYWPICYFTTWHVEGERCPDCSFGKMLACMKEKAPRTYWAAAPLMPYMRSVVRRRQHWLGRAAAVIAVSGHVADAAVRAIAGPGRTHVVPNLIDVDEVERESAAAPSVDLPDRFLLFVGKLVPMKGAAIAVEIASRLAPRVPLVIIGDGPERSAIERRSAELELDVRFLAQIPNVEVWRVMKRATALIAPASWAEPLSRTVIEAMAVGLAVVASDRGGIHDQIENDRSGIVLPLEVGVLAAAIDRLFADEAARRRLADEARLAARARFHAPVVRRQVEAVYSSILSSTRNGTTKRETQRS